MFSNCLHWNEKNPRFCFEESNCACAQTGNIEIHVSAFLQQYFRTIFSYMLIYKSTNYKLPIDVHVDDIIFEFKDSIWQQIIYQSDFFRFFPYALYLWESLHIPLENNLKAEHKLVRTKRLQKRNLRIYQSVRPNFITQ